MQVAIEKIDKNDFSGHKELTKKDDAGLLGACTFMSHEKAIVQLSGDRWFSSSEA